MSRDETPDDARARAIASKASRRQELLRAARDVFATKGYHDAKVDDICAIAKVAKGTFYLYFPDKRSVFAELVDSLFARLGEVIKTVDIAGDVAEQVRENIRGVVGVFFEDPALSQILLSYAAGLDPAFVAKINSFYDGTKTLLQESLAVGQTLGIIAKGDTALYATCTIGALKELLFENVRGGARAQEEIVEAIFGFLHRGYLRMDPAEREPSMDVAPDDPALASITAAPRVAATARGRSAGGSSATSAGRKSRR